MEKKDLTPDYFFEVAREIRRVWQIKTNSPMYINEKNTSNVLNKEAYDSQPAEVDANAFAGIVLLDCFGAEPDYTQFSQDTIKLIMDRMSDIDDEIQ